MKKLLILLALPLAACAPLLNSVAPSPSSFAQLTKVDEQLAVTAELGYKAFRIAVETGVKAGFIKGARADQLADLDMKLYTSLQTVELAYQTANEAQFTAALSDFNQLLKTANSNLGGK